MKGSQKLRDARELTLRQAHVEPVELEWVGEVLLDQLGKTLPGSPLKDFADDPTARPCVVAEVGVGLVYGPHVLDEANHVVPVEHLLG